MAKLKRDTRGALLFDCPCGSLHVIYPEGCDVPERPRWAWNGSLESPTFNPSLLVTWSHPAALGDELHAQLERKRADPTYLIPYKEHRCHSFITDGKIAFCGDSTHALAGQTVEIPDWED